MSSTGAAGWPPCQRSRTAAPWSPPPSPIAPETASGVNSAVSRAGSLFAIALLGGVLQHGGPQLFSGFHMAIAVAAIACVLAAFAVFIIEPGPHVDFIPRDYPVRRP